MNVLAEFLLARIAEDSEVHPQWGFPMNVALHGTGCMELVAVERSDAECDCGMPARYLAECEAKRRIVEMQQGAVEATVDVAPADGPIADAIVQSVMVTTTSVLRLLSLPYAAHPDYPEEWRP